MSTENQKPFTETPSSQGGVSAIANCKVFEFARDGKSYTVKSPSKEESIKFLKKEFGIEIKNCFEIPESDWDKKTIKVFYENNFEEEPYFTSLRELFGDDKTELLCTNDYSIID